jgi:hypothetical protein
LDPRPQGQEARPHHPRKSELKFNMGCIADADGNMIELYEADAKMG